MEAGGLLEGPGHPAKARSQVIAFIWLAVEAWYALLDLVPGGLVGLAFVAGFLANTACRVVAYVLGKEVWG